MSILIDCIKLYLLFIVLSIINHQLSLSLCFFNLLKSFNSDLIINLSLHIRKVSIHNQIIIIEIEED